jgi:hypothetical protein
MSENVEALMDNARQAIAAVKAYADGETIWAAVEAVEALPDSVRQTHEVEGWEKDLNAFFPGAHQSQ